MSIASNGTSFLSGLVSLRFVGSCNNTSAVWCLMRARCTNLKTNSDKQKRCQASRLGESAQLRIYFAASWSICMVSRYPFM